jgi:biotin carboxyl carrier protein
MWLAFAKPRSRTLAEPEAKLFRSEAVASHGNGRTTGKLLELSPRWSAFAYRLLVSTVLVALAWSTVGTIHEYAIGPALIRVEGRRDVTARLPGTVSEIQVQPGQRIRGGEVLLRFYGATENAQYERVSRELELQLVKLLRDPGDQSARASLTALHTQKELAESQVALRTVRAQYAGVVSDVRIRLGQQVQPGDVLLSTVQANSPCVIVAMLPGHYRPQLAPGASLRLELDGYRFAYREVTIDTISDDIIGPGELRRYLGAELADTVDVQGPTLLVRAYLSSNTFEARGQRLHYYDGMRATANVRVQTASILVTLVPGLKLILERTGG